MNRLGVGGYISGWIYIRVFMLVGSLYLGSRFDSALSVKRDEYIAKVIRYVRNLKHANVTTKDFVNCVKTHI